MKKYSTIVQGKKYSSDYKVYITRENKIISPFHDIDPVTADPSIFRCINEIPRFENAKFEISKAEPLNPIKQDVKNNSPRFVKNLFPNKGYLWNYGAIPQTWEDPNELDPEVHSRGDNDPLDVIEIGDRMKTIGEVYEAKVIGCLALLDEGECDYKIIVIDVRDKNSSFINDVSDVENFYKGLLERTVFWFKNYKIPDGKGENKFAFNGEFLCREMALQIISRAHQQWKKLMNEGYKGINTSGGTLELKDEELSDETLPEYVSAFYYFK